jgi:hypothetical protein
MFGIHNVPFRIEQEGVSLSVEQEEDHLLYRRECLGDKIEKTLLIDSGRIQLNPVEPLNRPKELTRYLMIELARPLVVGPKVNRRMFLRFPVEVGVYVGGDKKFEILDIFTLVRQKFTLYGDPRVGVICKYWTSDVSASIPDVNRVQEGVMEVILTNTDTERVEISRAVFNAYGMKIYYNDKLVSMKATMRVKSEEVAETDFVDSALVEGMKKSLEIYSTRRLSVTDTKFVMELGL